MLCLNTIIIIIRFKKKHNTYLLYIFRLSLRFPNDSVGLYLFGPSGRARLPDCSVSPWDIAQSWTVCSTFIALQSFSEVWTGLYSMNKSSSGIVLKLHEPHSLSPIHNPLALFKFGVLSPSMEVLLSWSQLKGKAVTNTYFKTQAKSCKPHVIPRTSVYPN